MMVVDVSNLYYTIRKTFNPKARLDYGKLIQKFKDSADVRRSIAYGADIQGGATGFRDALTHLGFETRYKEPKVFSGAGGKQTRKADWDVGMAIDIVRYAPEYDILILGTADGDLAPCVEFIREAKVKVWIIGCGISRDLKDTCDHWQEIEECDLLSNPTNGPAPQPL